MLIRFILRFRSGARGGAILLAMVSMGCRAILDVTLDVGSTRLAIGDSLLVVGVFGHDHLFRDDIHATSRALS
jgi:hypothetical protein